MWYNSYMNTTYKNWGDNMEKWKDIKGYEGKYQISDHGRVKTVRTGFIHKKRTTFDGYVKATLTVNSRAKDFRVHRLVALHFVDNPNNKETVNHIDGNKENNHVSNLEWSTREENMQHAYSLGLKEKMNGCKSLHSKFTVEDIKYIRSVYKPKCKTYGMRPLAKKFGVHTSTIESIALYKTYKEI